MKLWHDYIGDHEYEIMCAVTNNQLSLLRDGYMQGIESGTVITTALEMEKFLWDSSETAIHCLNNQSIIIIIKIWLFNMATKTITLGGHFGICFAYWYLCPTYIFLYYI